MKILGVELVPGTKYRGRLLVHWSKFLSKNKMLDKFRDGGVTDIKLYEPEDLPQDWPASQRENVEDKWTAFLEGTFSGGNPEMSDKTSDYEFLGFWKHPPETGDPVVQPKYVSPFPAPRKPLKEGLREAVLIVAGAAVTYAVVRHRFNRK